MFDRYTTAPNVHLLKFRATKNAKEIPFARINKNAKGV